MNESLRRARLSKGLSQKDLAARASVSRQAISAFEAGQAEPSLRVALCLSEVLELSVEELFASDRLQATVGARAIDQAAPSAGRVALFEVGGINHALPLHLDNSMRTGFVPASGTSTSPGQVKLLGAQPMTIAIAGCDPATSLLEPALERLDPAIALCWCPSGSRLSLELGASRAVHVAGIHLRDERHRDYNLAAVRASFPGSSAIVYHFARWREGLVLRDDEHRTISGPADIARKRLRVAQREPGSEARNLFERVFVEAGVETSGLLGMTSSAKGHFQVASAVASGMADVGITTEPVALAFGLRFMALSEESYDLVVARELGDSLVVQGLSRVLRSSYLRAQLGAISGYDVSDLGERIELS